MKKIVPITVGLLLCSVSLFAQFDKKSLWEGWNPESPFPDSVDRVKMLKLINQIRAEGCICGDSTYLEPMPPLVWSQSLVQAARQHAKDMAENDFFNHTGSDGSSAGDRVRIIDPNYASVSENITYNQNCKELAIRATLHSKLHCFNLMSKFGHSEIGVATKNGYWVFVFGRPKEE